MVVNYDWIQRSVMRYGRSVCIKLYCTYATLYLTNNSLLDVIRQYTPPFALFTLFSQQLTTSAERFEGTTTRSIQEVSRKSDYILVASIAYKFERRESLSESKATEYRRHFRGSI